MNNIFSRFDRYRRRRPDAYANIMGDAAHPEIVGAVGFYKTRLGVIVTATVQGLPKSTDKCTSPIFAFHIHGGGSCTGNSDDPFANAKAHYNPRGCKHPYHAGDLPPLFGANGYAFLTVLINRFTVDEIIGKTVIIHSFADDFTSQPSGMAGAKIACGEIVSG